MLKRALIITGVMAAVVLVAPWLVILGSFFIFPGLILAIIPTAFIYLFGFAVIRRYLPIYKPLALNAAAAALVVALGWLTAQPSVLLGKINYARLHDSDVLSAAPVRLAGHIKLEYVRAVPTVLEGDMPCDKLCAALLRTPGVASITMAARETDEEPANARTTWRLVSKGSVLDGGLLPVSPEDIFGDLPSDLTQKAPKRDFGAEIDKLEARGKAFAAEWALRLSTRETLLSEAPRESFDMVIRIVDERRLGGTHQRVEVTIGDSVALRKTVVRIPVLSAPVAYLPNGGIQNFSFNWARTYLANGPAYPELKPITWLFERTTLARPTVDPDASERLRARLFEVLGDPAASKSDLALAYAWNASMRYNKATKISDAELMAGIIGDPRFGVLTPFLKDLQASPALRDAAAQRILYPGTLKEDRWSLALILYELPKGSFAQLSPAEREILSDPVLRLQAAPLMTRAADGGPKVLPNLIAWLRDVSTLRADYHQVEALRTQAQRYPRDGLARLGLDAAPALPLVLELFGESGGNLTDSGNGAQEWRVAMLRMGLPPERLPWSKDWNAEQIANQRADICV